MQKFLLIILFLILSLITFLKVNALGFSLVITEIMYNPEGNDTDREWLEVFNQSNRTFYLKSGKNGWRINDGENHLFKDELTIYPQEVFVIVQDKNKFLSDYHDFKGKIVSANFSLKNSLGRIQLFDENKNLITEIDYQNNCGGDNNGYSIVFEGGVCRENKVKKGTPGLYPENIETESQQSLHQKTTSSKIETFSSSFIIGTPTLITQETTGQATFPEEVTPLTLYISEFLPNPQGNDSGQEFVELYNYGHEAINLEDFFLEVNKRKIKLQGLIEAREYFVITNKDYNFYIRNQGEILNLYYKDQKIFSISYQGKAPEGKSFSRFANFWQFTTPTPFQENKLTTKKIEISEINNLNQVSQQQGSNFQANILSKPLDKNSKINYIGLVIIFLLLIIALSFLIVYFY